MNLLRFLRPPYASASLNPAHDSFGYEARPASHSPQGERGGRDSTAPLGHGDPAQSDAGSRAHRAGWRAYLDQARQLSVRIAESGSTGGASDRAARGHALTQTHGPQTGRPDVSL